LVTAYFVNAIFGALAEMFIKYKFKFRCGAPIFKTDNVADPYLFGSTFSTSFGPDHGSISRGSEFLIFPKMFEILNFGMIFEERRKSRNAKKRISEDLFIDLFHWDMQAI
jgi:hypothetical protein